MSRKEWNDIYCAAWEAFYTREHQETILRRAAATDMGLSRLSSVLFFFANCFELEGVHPLQGGLLRLKFRSDRRPGLPVEPIWSFYPKYAWELLSKHALSLKRWLELQRVCRRVRRDPQRKLYTDLALMPVTDDETDTLEMFTHNDAARDEVIRTRKIAALTHSSAVPVEAQQA